MSDLRESLLLFFFFLANVFQTLLHGRALPPENMVTTSRGAVDYNYVQVARVVDGDTIILKDGKRVHYIGIDTPEMGGEGMDRECYAAEATEKNRTLVEGKMVRIERDVSDTDKYGRLLRYVYLDDTFINEELLKTGHAKAVSYPPDSRYDDYFSNLQDDAIKHNLGLWQKCTDSAE